MSSNVECVVVGAGVIGLAVARALALAGREVVVVEKNAAAGEETSARNSEVIHAGLYYPPGSLKARLCVEGRERLYAYCAERGIGHRRLGKLLVATDEAQRAGLDSIAAQAEANGVEDLERLDAAAAKQLEPELVCLAALLSPSTGIIDSHAYLLSLRGEAETAGASVALNTPAIAAWVADRGFVVRAGGAEPLDLACRYLVNAAGLGAQAFAHRLAGFDAALVPPLHLAKGNYFVLIGAAPFRRLVYPLPDRAGLGVHVTLDLAGRARFGPDVEWVNAADYDVDPARAAAFYPAIRAYWPGLPDDGLEPGYAGIRPKLTPAGAAPADFIIQGAAKHGLPGLVNLFGIESPGLTASLAIADEVLTRLGIRATGE
jgi:L-2-hydroxyglutarate oxidase LhgO